MIGSLLRHTLVLVGGVPAAPLDPDGDDRGHVTRAPTELGTYQGLIQPRTARERASVGASDVNIGTHRIYLEASALPVVDVDHQLRKAATAPDPDLAGTYRIVGISNAAGFGHHLEIDAELIRP